MRGPRFAGALLGLILAAPLWGGEAPYLLADVERGPSMAAVEAGPSGFFELGGRLFFSTTNPRSLDQGILWSTDGTSRGTVQVSASLCVARCTEITPLATGNGLAWLRIAAGRSTSGSFYRLARTDGTPAGTYVVTGLLSSDPYFHPLEVHLLPGVAPAFFTACSGDCTLWWSDGSRSGTGPFPGADGRPFYEPRSFTVWRNRLYFVASRTTERGETGLWSTDGTVQGTRLVHALSDLGNNRPDPPVVATPSRLFFVSGPTNEDLWETDGTAEGSRLLADFPPVGCEDGCEIPDVYTLAAFGDTVYFETPKKDGQRARIWRSDGTPEGTRPLIDLPARIEAVDSLRRIGGHWLFAGRIHEWDTPYPWTVDDGFTYAQPLGTCGGEPCPTISGLSSGLLPGLGLFDGYDGQSGLWVTDGTGPGTRRLPDLCGLRPALAGSPDFVPSPDGRRLYLQGCPNDDGIGELWVTDGTPVGTHRVGGLFSGIGFLNGRVYYGSKPPDRPAAEIWEVGDTPKGERRVAVLRRFRAGSEPWFQPLGKGVTFATYRENGQAGLWRSDGTRAGTVPLYEFPAGYEWYIANFIPLGKSLQVFWVYRSPLDGYGSTPELWRTDGTAGGTRFMASFEEGDYLYTGTPWNDRAVFAVSGDPDCSLWSTDGTSPGTRRLDLPPSLGCPSALTALGPRFLFLAREKHSRRPVTRLFVSDGTRAGTVPIARFEGNAYGSETVVASGAAWINVVYRDENNNDARSEIWRTDGTAGGTRLTASLLRTENLHAFGDSLYLTADEESDEPGLVDGQALFRIPLAGGEPVRLARVTSPPVYFLDGVRYAPLGDRLAFMTYPWFGDGNRDLWVTDGTPEGTRRIRRFLPWPGMPGIFPIEDLVSSGSKLYFPAGDGSHGRELWESDGTPEGSRMVVDLAPGGLSGIPDSSSLAINNGVLFFSADDGKSGPEPWALRLLP